MRAFNILIHTTLLNHILGFGIQGICIPKFQLNPETKSFFDIILLLEEWFLSGLANLWVKDKEADSL